jgi:hypothetical protein
MLIALLIAAAAPSVEALTLGRQIAESGTLASVLPLIQQKETEELIAAHPELSAEQQAALRATARQVYKSGWEKLMQTEAEAYARQLRVTDLRAIAAFQKSSAGKRYRSSAPDVIGAAMQSVGKLDFKGDVLAAYCKQTGKLCSK